ncbi:hypothetical protein VTP01DRAFT_10709 [Rhizomucor pusillus]|uniref:uncharacterized protein n=1 Tax=Rhizomucor pusillus TaxID=4840 RepID=UPI003744110D
MGLFEKLRSELDLHKVNKYTKRRVDQSHFASHDRQYYESAYKDGVYVDPMDQNEHVVSAVSSSLRRSLTGMFKKSGPPSQYKTSETYTLGLTR